MPPLKASRPDTGSVIITFAGHVVGHRNGLTREQIDRFVREIGEMTSEPTRGRLRLVQPSADQS